MMASCTNAQPLWVGALRGPAVAVIAELKRRVPIWKQEQYVDGHREWVDPTALGTSPANPEVLA